MIAEVLIDLSVKGIDRLFDYLIPKEELNSIQVGMRVYVPFGGTMRLGFVLGIKEESDFDIEDLKEISEVLDLSPVLDEELILYYNYLSKTNYSLQIDVIKTILPKELFLTYYQTLTVNDFNKLDKILKPLFDKRTIKYTNNLKEYKSLIEKALKDNILTLNREYEEKGRNKYIKAIYYKGNDTYKNKDRYLDLINYIKENPGLTRSELTERDYNLSSINTLIKNEVLEVIEEIAIRHETFKKTDLIKEHELNKDQLDAYNEISNELSTNNTYLLHGITGSGKTEVYMQLMADVLDSGKNVLYLVPELTLIAPTMRYLKSRFNLEITHYNSSLSKGVRFDAWYQISNKEARIVVGTRSSSFLPIDNLGIIIVDEEHDNAYLGKGNVHYDLIDILNLKKNYHHIPLILGSATPKVSSMYEALNNNYKLIELPIRATNQELPKITYVDMKEELNSGNVSIFSKILKDKIVDRLNKKEQVILLYNRVGYSSFVLCRTCGHVPKCQNCDISLTYYKEDKKLKCRHCKYEEDMPKECPSCHSTKINTIGMGIDQIYERVIREFKTARVIKMDSHSMRHKGSLEETWLKFKNHEADILVGTKMVSKGLDFPKVTLVGILMADLELKVPTYLASEQTYSLITQMVGRSGRSLIGEAVIQGYDLEHFAIKEVENSYQSFYKKALSYREIANYPPFTKVFQILIKNKSYLKAYQDALNIKKAFENLNIKVLGPSEPQIKYINNEYRFLITSKVKEIDYDTIFNILKEYKESIIEFYNSLEVI